MTDPTRYEIYARTETGHMRERNEDHFLARRICKNSGSLTFDLAAGDPELATGGMLLAVADGIGGAPGGATASRLVLISLDHCYAALDKGLDLAAYKHALSSAIEQTNAFVVELACGHRELAGMGCTLTGVCLAPAGFLVFNVGDSRVYRARNASLRALTRDETLGEQRQALGQKAFDSAQAKRDAHTLVNAMGQNNIQHSITAGPTLRHRDLLLICSDGIHGLVEEQTLGQLLDAPDRPVAEIGDAIAQQALDNGGSDNLSLIVLRALSDEHASADDSPSPLQANTTPDTPAWLAPAGLEPEAERIPRKEESPAHGE